MLRLLLVAVRFPFLNRMVLGSRWVGRKKLTKLCLWLCIYVVVYIAFICCVYRLLVGRVGDPYFPLLLLATVCTASSISADATGNLFAEILGFATTLLLVAAAATAATAATAAELDVTAVATFNNFGNLL